MLLAGIVRIPYLKHSWWNSIIKYTVTAAVALFGSLLAYLHLKWIDPQFIQRGRVFHSVNPQDDNAVAKPQGKPVEKIQHRDTRREKRSTEENNPRKISVKL